MAIEVSLILYDYSVVAVDSHRTIIVGDRKGEDLPVKLFLALYSSIEFDYTFYGNSYTISVLSVGDI